MFSSTVTLILTKKTEEQKTQGTNKKSISIKRQEHKALYNIHLSE